MNERGRDSSPFCANMSRVCFILAIVPAGFVLVVLFRFLMFLVFHLLYAMFPASLYGAYADNLGETLPTLPLEPFLPLHALWISAVLVGSALYLGKQGGLRYRFIYFFIAPAVFWFLYEFFAPGLMRCR